MWSLCATLLVLIIFLVWLYGTRETYRSCPEKTCTRTAPKGRTPINPFVWPWSGSACYDMPKASFEGYEDRGSVDVTADDNGRAVANTANDNTDCSIHQEHDHDVLSV